MNQNENYIKQWENLISKHRSYLVSFAFRMTGSLSEAEDLVQDTFIECAEIDPATIQNPKSWLTKVCSNKGLDHLKSAYKKREDYSGTWLPDAVPDSLHIWGPSNSNNLPDQNLLSSESLTTSFLLLIERLTPEERVVYLLSEVFEYPFKDIASFLNKSEEACRKMAQRARQSVVKNRPGFSADAAESEKLIAKFFESAKAGDHQALVEMLSEDSEFWADGGGKVSASHGILKDPARIANFFKGIWSPRHVEVDHVKFEVTWVNSRPGFVISKKLPAGVWVFDTILSFEMKDGKIARIFAQRNPDKLQALNRTV